MKDERERDLAWIKENLGVLLTQAIAAFQEQGRGALLISEFLPGVVPLVRYVLARDLPQSDAKRMARLYNPLNQMIVVMLKAGDPATTYRVGEESMPKPQSN